ncbi:hypothetical protein HZZ13_08905 [Bradyrhizobium sp. CNPSo 4010]|uniref:Uncharacterized protein n=1 Tax=Bradyrhizobium agreste TaxID=2751811 RepID=A0ABS0PLF1_9BRAD|nr:hypothetical protein [Bradyrhizobium agreste]MBH5397910.1 hypothetical protein [Bradyrhizobium agreste]
MTSLRTKTKRLQLERRKKPYFMNTAPGISLGYRRLELAGSWCVRAADGAGNSWLRGIDAIADDYEDANGDTVLTFEQAIERAKERARGLQTDVKADHSKAPLTVDDAVNLYEDDLKARGGGVRNATDIRIHVKPGMLATEVQALTSKELRPRPVPRRLPLQPGGHRVQAPRATLPRRALRALAQGQEQRASRVQSGARRVLVHPLPGGQQISCARRKSFRL